MSAPPSTSSSTSPSTSLRAGLRTGLTRRQFLKLAASAVGSLAVLGGRQNLPDTPLVKAAVVESRLAVGPLATPVEFAAGLAEDEIQLLPDPNPLPPAQLIRASAQTPATRGGN